MHRTTGRAVLAGTLATLAAALVACAAGGVSGGASGGVSGGASGGVSGGVPGGGSMHDRPVGLAAIAGSGGSVTSPVSSSSTAPSQIQVTVPELTVAGTIANLMAPAVTVPPTTSTAPPAPEPAPGAAAPAPAAPAPAADIPTAPPAQTPTPQAPAPSAPTVVVPPYTTVLGWTGEGKVAYLTFDDGPGPATGQMLDILAAKGVKATFCVVGQKVTENGDMTRRIGADGHTLCNHSWDHPTGFNTLPADALAGQIGRTQDAVTQATGHPPRYLRAPEGRFGDPDGSVHQAAQQARTLLLGWAVDSKDWTKPGAATIVSNVMGSVSPGAIILMHDAGGTDRRQTLDALPGVIDGLQAAGYTLLPLPPDPAG